MVTLTARLKEEYCDPNYPPTEDAHWWPAGRALAMAILALNDDPDMQTELIHGPLAANPESPTWEGLVGNICTPPNEFGKLVARFTNYDEIQLPYLPKEFPAKICFGDTSERKQIGVDPETGDPIYETVYGGTIQ